MLLKKQITHFSRDVLKNAALRVSEIPRKTSLVELLSSNLSNPIYPYNYTENSLHRKCFLWVFREFLQWLGKRLCWNNFLVK